MLKLYTIKLTRANVVDNTKILYHESNFKKLTILEALEIKNLNPSINSQCTGPTVYCNCSTKFLTPTVK